MSLWSSLNVLVADLHPVGLFLLPIGCFWILPFISTLRMTDFSFVHYWGTVEVVEGTLTDIQFYDETENDETGETFQNFLYYFRFETPNGMMYDDASFGGSWNIAKGAKVRVEYPAGKPYLARIKGLRRERYAPWVALFAVFPLFVGLITAMPGLRRGIRAKRLLKHGHVTTGRLVSHEEVRKNDKLMYRVQVAFDGEDGREYQVAGETDVQKEAYDVLFNPSKPESAQVVDSLPLMPVIGGDDQVRFTGSLKQGKGTQLVFLLMIIGMCLFFLMAYLLRDYFFYLFFAFVVLFMCAIVYLGFRFGKRK